MRRNFLILMIFISVLVLTQCAPKVAKQTKQTSKNEQPDNRNNTTPLNSIQQEPLQGNTPLPAGKANDPERIQGLTDAEKSAYQQQVVTNGKLIWSTRCNKCHELYQPSTRTTAQWDKILEVMAPKAKLDEMERLHVTAYLHSAAKVK